MFVLPVQGAAWLESTRSRPQSGWPYITCSRGISRDSFLPLVANAAPTVHSAHDAT